MTYEEIVTTWKNKKIINSAALDVTVGDLVTEYAYHTTRLEIPTVTKKDTREILKTGTVTKYTGSVRDIISIQNSKYGWEYLLYCFDANAVMDEPLVKEFHRILTGGSYDDKRYIDGERPGHYKKHDFVTGRYEIGALAEDVPDEMAELLEDIKDAPAEKALRAAAFFHAKFENIRPFADGNGRAGRLLMNYFLVMHDHPFIIIHEEDSRSYTSALEAWDWSQSLDELEAVLKEQTVKTWEGRI